MLVIIAVAGLVPFCGIRAQQIVTNAEPVTIAWDANTEEDLAGYNVYIEDTEDPAQDVIIADVGNVTQYTLSAIEVYRNQVNEIKLTAYNEDGLESDFSNSVLVYYAEPPAPPQNNHIVGELEASYDGGRSWEPVYGFGPIPMESEQPMAAYRFRGDIKAGAADAPLELTDLREERTRSTDADASEPAESIQPPMPPGLKDFRRKQQSELQETDERHRLQRELEELERRGSRRPD